MNKPFPDKMSTNSYTQVNIHTRTHTTLSSCKETNSITSPAPNKPVHIPLNTHTLLTHATSVHLCQFLFFFKAFDDFNDRVAPVLVCLSSEAAVVCGGAPKTHENGGQQKAHMRETLQSSSSDEVYYLDHFCCFLRRGQGSQEQQINEK
jgi:hypothetical protein